MKAVCGVSSKGPNSASVLILPVLTGTLCPDMS